jgi:hypothetical protein
MLMILPAAWFASQQTRTSSFNSNFTAVLCVRKFNNFLKVLSRHLNMISDNIYRSWEINNIMEDWYVAFFSGKGRAGTSGRTPSSIQTRDEQLDFSPWTRALSFKTGLWAHKLGTGFWPKWSSYYSIFLLQQEASALWNTVVINNNGILIHFS